MVREGWPENKTEVPENLLDLYTMRADLSESNGLLLRGRRIIIPRTMRQDILERIHDGHQGIHKCRERARDSVWWPGINDDIKNRVATCSHCQTTRPSQKKEPLIPTILPDRAFQKVGADIFDFNKSSYLVLIDYYSRYLEIAHLANISSSTVIGRLKNIFAHHGIPEVVHTDNGSQLVSKEYRNFAKEWGFDITTSSPYHAPSNGEAERAVQLAKKILEQEDPFKALLVYRATPTSPTGVSPAELAMGRKLRTQLPSISENLKPKRIDREAVEARDRRSKEKYKRDFDKRNNAETLPPLQPGDVVLVKLDNEKKWHSPSTVVERYAPRSYIIQSEKGVFRRNRRYLKRAEFLQAAGNHPGASSPGAGQHSLRPNVPKLFNPEFSPYPVPRRVAEPRRAAEPSKAEPSRVAEPSAPAHDAVAVRGEIHDAVAVRGEIHDAVAVRGCVADNAAAARGGDKFQPSTGAATAEPAGFAKTMPAQQTTRSGRLVKLPGRYQE